MINIEKDIEDLKKQSDYLEKEIKCISDDIYKGSLNITPLHVLTNIIRELKVTSDGHTKLISDINQEALKARNQVVYMFITLLGTIFAKYLFQYFIG